MSILARAGSPPITHSRFRSPAARSTPTAGAPHYEKDKRTCVLPVKLEAGKVYAIWLNSAKFTNFKDTDGHPAVLDPYRDRLATLGRRVRVELPRGVTLEGEATAVADDGALVVRDAAGTDHSITAADVIHLRPV